MKLITAALTLFMILGGPASADDGPEIVFVCEHGAAKSLIATEYFNKLAEEQGLSQRATFRGTSPQENLSVSASAGLRADGFTIPKEKPTAIEADDIAQATHIFAIGCALPDAAVATGKTVNWTDVPSDQGYGPMRDAIVKHVRSLLDEIEGRSP